MHPIKAVIFDKDDTFMQDMVYSAEFDAGSLFPDTVESCAMLARAGFSLFILSNQSGIERGAFLREELDRNYLSFRDSVFSACGGMLSGFLYCPHLPERGCSCRKPSVGLFKQLDALFVIDSAHSFYVGDRLSDVEFAMEAGLAPVVIHRPDYRYKDPRIYQDICRLEEMESEGSLVLLPSLLSFAALAAGVPQ